MNQLLIMIMIMINSLQAYVSLRSHIVSLRKPIY